MSGDNFCGVCVLGRGGGGQLLSSQPLRCSLAPGDFVNVQQRSFMELIHLAVFSIFSPVKMIFFFNSFSSLKICEYIIEQSFLPKVT